MTRIRQPVSISSAYATMHACRACVLASPPCSYSLSSAQSCRLRNGSVSSKVPGPGSGCRPRTSTTVDLPSASGCSAAIGRKPAESGGAPTTRLGKSNRSRHCSTDGASHQPYDLTLEDPEVLAEPLVIPTRVLRRNTGANAGLIRERGNCETAFETEAAATQIRH